MTYMRPITRAFGHIFKDEAILHPGALAQDCHRALRSLIRSKHWSHIRTQLRAFSYLPLGTTPDTIKEALEQTVMELRPWRTGPMSLGSMVIDAEWRSDQKWARIQPLLPSLEGSRVADVGCSNGFFLYKLAESDPALVVGFDPVERCFLQFVLTSLFQPHPRIAFLPIGLDSIRHLHGYFDLILCMGVIYHQRDPFTAVKQLYNALRPGGTLLLESLSIPTDEDVLLIPRERYAKMRNAWSIPSPKAMENFLHRAGFSEISQHRFGALTTLEQRRTPFAHFESLTDFLDPSDPSKTVEGYPAPHSAAVRGVKPLS